MFTWRQADKMNPEGSGQSFAKLFNFSLQGSFSGQRFFIGLFKSHHILPEHFLLRGKRLSLLFGLFKQLPVLQVGFDFGQGSGQRICQLPDKIDLMCRQSSQGGQLHHTQNLLVQHHRYQQDGCRIILAKSGPDL